MRRSFLFAWESERSGSVLSERKGGPHKIVRKTVNLDGETHALLVKYCQIKKLKMSLVLPMFIAKAVEHDIFDQDWIEKLKKAESMVNRYASLDGACPALAGGKKSSGDWLYRCVWFRPDNPPNIKSLGDTEELQAVACLSCGGTKPYVLGIEERDERIAELETELKGRADNVFKAPKCNGGGNLYNDEEDQLVFRNCKKHPSGPVSVEKFCRVYQGGLPCMSFAEVTVGVSERI